MRRKMTLPLTLLVLLSMILGACSFTPTSEQPVVEVGGDPLSGSGGGSDSSVSLNIPSMLNGFWAGVPASASFGSVGAAALSVEMVDHAPFLVDVRQESEITAGGFIVGAVNIPIRQLLNNLDKLPGLDDPIVLYDVTGHRAALGMMALRLLGYTNVRNLDGGASSWGKLSLPFITGNLPAAPAVRSSLVISNELLVATLNDFLTNLPEDFYRVKVDELAAELATSTPVLIDVRIQADWDTAHIAGSIVIDFNTFLNHLAELPADKSTRIVVYDNSGHRGALVTEALRLLGYTNVYNLAGGFYSWKAAGQPVLP